MRKYVSGTQWCLWRWSEFKQDQYIDRLHLIKTPWFAVCLHWINKPDAEPYLHDHPVTFLSVILRGGYLEIRGRHGIFKRHTWYNFIRATDKHTIVQVEPNTLTICFMGPKTREWGFHTGDGWVHWKKYYEEQRKAE